MVNTMRRSKPGGAEYRRRAQAKWKSLESCIKLYFFPKGSDTAQEANLSRAASSSAAVTSLASENKEQRDGKMKADDMEGMDLPFAITILPRTLDCLPLALPSCIVKVHV